MNNIRTFISGLLLALLAQLSIASPSAVRKDTTLATNAQKSFFDQLEGEEPLAMTLTAEWDSLLTDPHAPGYIPADLQYANEQGVLQQWNIKLTTRGKFRLRTCDFPPLKLKFSKKELAERGLQSDFNKYKLVTRCLDRKRLGDELVLREYLAYRLFEQLSDKSYQTKLVKLFYQYPDGRMHSSGYGILLEETDEVGARFQAREVDLFNPAPDSLDARQEVRVALFQYMIGNADWTYTHMRNLKLYRTADGTGYFAVPYDFDFSGLVGAPYASPSVELGQRHVGDRVFMGLSHDQALLRREIGYILSRKEALLQAVRSFDHLTRSSRREILYYLEPFFETLEKVQRNRDLAVEAQLQEKQSGPGRGSDGRLR